MQETIGILCSHCKKVKKRICSHHVIPIWCGGKVEDIMDVCVSCHTKLENMFKNFIFYGSLKKPKPYTDIEKTRKSRRNFYNNHKEEICFNHKTPLFRKKMRDYRSKNRNKINERVALWRLRTGRTKNSQRLKLPKNGRGY